MHLGVPIEAFVYYIAAPEYQMVKIGVALDPTQRFKKLQAVNFAELVIVSLVRSKDAYALEARLHLQWERHAVRGEWFSTRSQRAKNLIPPFFLGCEDGEGNLVAQSV